MASSDSPLEVTGATRVAAVIGHPIVHSLSPAIHNAGFRSSGSDIVYVAFDVSPGQATDALRAARTLGFIGLSVTMPHKFEIARAVNSLSPSAQKLDSVNTVEFEGEETIGHSTDGDGLVGSLAAQGCDVRGKSVVVFGAGGAARSVVDALARHGAARLGIINRTLDAAIRAAELAPGVCTAVDGADKEAVAQSMGSADLVINATSVGMATGERVSDRTRHNAPDHSSDLPVDASLLTSNHVVVDLVYHPLQTPLLQAAARCGCQTIDGLGMLVHQAALQQLIWTGLQPDVEEMTRAALRALAEPR